MSRLTPETLARLFTPEQNLYDEAEFKLFDTIAPELKRLFPDELHLIDSLSDFKVMTNVAYRRRWISYPDDLKPDTLDTARRIFDQELWLLLSHLWMSNIDQLITSHSTGTADASSKKEKLTQALQLVYRMMETESPKLPLTDNNPYGHFTFGLEDEFVLKHSPLQLNFDRYHTLLACIYNVFQLPVSKKVEDKKLTELVAKGRLLDTLTEIMNHPLRSLLKNFDYYAVTNLHNYVFAYKPAILASLCQENGPLKGTAHYIWGDNDYNEVISLPTLDVELQIQAWEALVITKLTEQLHNFHLTVGGVQIDRNNLEVMYLPLLAAALGLLPSSLFDKMVEISTHDSEVDFSELYIEESDAKESRGTANDDYSYNYFPFFKLRTRSVLLHYPAAEPRQDSAVEFRGLYGYVPEEFDLFKDFLRIINVAIPAIKASQDLKKQPGSPQQETLAQAWRQFEQSLTQLLSEANAFNGSIEPLVPRRTLHFYRGTNDERITKYHKVLTGLFLLAYQGSDGQWDEDATWLREQAAQLTYEFLVTVTELFGQPMPELVNVPQPMER